MRVLVALVLAAGTAVAAPHPFGFDDMARLGRLGGFDVSRDGKWVVYSVGRADVDENKTTSALWLMPIDRSAPPRKLTAGVKKDHDAAFSPGGAPDYDVAPDGKTMIYASNHDRVEAISTNSDVWELTFGDGQARCLSCDNKAWDGDARYSPDGKLIAWRAQKRPGFESDKFDL